MDMKIKRFDSEQNRPDGSRASGVCLTRRGSALLIVIGTLALISVFAAVYVSIGRTDRRAAGAVQSKIDQQDTATTIGEYLSSTIASDRLEATVEHADFGGSGFGRREATDAPYTDFTRRSEGNPQNPADLFTPSGGILALGNLSSDADHRVASDPWLASTTPVYLGDPGFQNADRPFSTFEPFDTSLPNASNFLDNRDWLQISNFAPDGRFVNLYNLRPNSPVGSFDPAVDTDIGRFSAQPGTGVSIDSDGRRIRRMSNYLSLWKKSSNQPDSLIQTLDPTLGIWVPGQNAPVMLPGITDVFNTPAVWTMYQRFMFMPINEPFITLNRNNELSTWADPDFPAYQYVDADGDGMADSRWFELVSARDFNQGVGTQSRTDVKRLYSSKKYRYFVAARAVDLSSMVNVNTATDLLVPPTKEYPLGQTPADVDLRRLLTISDPAVDYARISGSNFLRLSYQFLHRPYVDVNQGQPLYGNPDPQRNLVRNIADYWHYQQGSGVDIRLPVSNSNSMLIGRYAYDALRQGITLGSSLSSAYQGYDYSVQNPSTRQDLLQYERDPASPNLVPAQITAQQRMDQYMQVGRLDPTNLGTSWSRGSDFGSGLYGIDDLIELLSFFGLNDPEVTSRLERVTTGRFQSPGNDGLQTQRLGPLMSNRPLALDRQQHGLAMIDINGDPRLPPSSNDSPLREVNGRVSFNSMAHFALTPRTKLTTISGSVPLLGTELVTDPTQASALSASSVAPVLKDVLSDPIGLFKLYSGALAGELDTPLNGSRFIANSSYWPMATDQLQRNMASSLFYGHRGPELALRIAAHSAVNEKDLNDEDLEPTAATLILDNSLRDTLITNYSGNSINDPAYTNNAGRAADTVFDPGQINLLDNQFTGMQAHRKAVNVFGMEPMPLLTEVSSMYVYTDASEAGGGEKDYNSSFPRLLGGRLITPSQQVKVTINGDVGVSNSDFMGEILAFQLTNPWNTPITIGGSEQGKPMDYIDDTNNHNLKFDYYIEYGGRFFKLGEFVEYNPGLAPVFDPSEYPDAPFSTPGGEFITQSAPKYQYRSVTIPANSSRVFYVFADGRFDNQDGSANSDNKWLAEAQSVNGSIAEFNSLDLDGDTLFDGFDGQGWTGPAEEWVNQELTIRGGARPVHIHQFDPRTGELVEQDGFHDLFTAPTTPVFNSATRAHDFTQARLWRKIKGKLEENKLPSPPTGAIDDNLIQNDLLVDRISAPDASYFQQPLDPGNNDINGTYGFSPTDYPQSEANRLGVRNDNFGLSIVRWATVRRGDNPAGDRGGSQLGKVSSWMMGSRDRSMNTIESTDPYGSMLDISDFLEGTLSDLEQRTNNLAGDRPDYEVHTTFFDLFHFGVTSTTTQVVQTITREPRQKYQISTGLQNAGVDLATRFPALVLPTNSLGQDLHTAGSSLVPELLVDSKKFQDAPRLGDLLLAWGIGPTYTPDPARVAADLSFDENDEGKRWITMPEALAFGLGFETPAAYNASEPEAENIWFNSMSSLNDQILDNGHLVLDNFVSYLNKDTTEIPLKFTPGAGGDILRGTGVPMALGVIDQARAIAPLDQITDPPSPRTPTEQLAIELGRATFGQININTAPIEVLRLLPGLTPSRAQYNASSGVENEWWESRFPNTNLPDLSPSDLSKNPDVAAAIVAYRDRTYAVPNTAARPELFTGADYDDNPMNLEPTDINLVLENMQGEFPFATLPTGNAPFDRSTMTGIDGVRPTPGFGSLGELLAVRVDPDLKTLASTRWDATKQLSIQQYGFDGVASGIESDVTIMSQLFGGDETGTTKDDYAEKLSMADSVLNTLSVRSDYFAVWFVIQGYQESDVANLRPEDPLIPSLKKRYLMVVDRTNVIKPGDKPKILVLKELPL